MRVILRTWRGLRSGLAAAIDSIRANRSVVFVETTVRRVRWSAALLALPLCFLATVYSKRAWSTIPPMSFFDSLFRIIVPIVPVVLCFLTVSLWISWYRRKWKRAAVVHGYLLCRSCGHGLREHSESRIACPHCADLNVVAETKGLWLRFANSRVHESSFNEIPAPLRNSRLVCEYGGRLAALFVIAWGIYIEHELTNRGNTVFYSTKFILPFMGLMTFGALYLRALWLERRWLARAAKAQGELCLACGYSLRGSTSATGRCPECGRAFDLEESRRRWSEFRPDG